MDPSGFHRHGEIKCMETLLHAGIGHPSLWWIAVAVGLALTVGVLIGKTSRNVPRRDGRTTTDER